MDWGEGLVWDVFLQNGLVRIGDVMVLLENQWRIPFLSLNRC